MTRSTLAPLLLALAIGCRPADLEVVAERWSEADALFEGDARWLGADAAFSVDLGDDRTLWLFGDTFVGLTDDSDRSDSRMVRNTVGVQTGRDPTASTMEFAWREAGGEPASFFPESGDEWIWPGQGIRRAEGLTLFVSRVGPSDEGLGFRAAGWTAYRVAEPDLPPLQWDVQELAVPETDFDLVGGVAAAEVDGQVLAWCVNEPNSHDLFLMRWTSDDFAAGELTRPQWWSDGGWVDHEALSGRPTTVIAAAATEFSMSPQPGGDGWLQVQTLGFGSTTIGVRTAEQPQGPWSSATDVFRPPESDRDDAFVYAGKGHPELEGADLVVTYAANAWDFWDLVADPTLYYPRFVKLTLR